jgi:NAD(P)-dependent dehydrogenase (short-subunit alcohol dehydrogenase family)
MSTMDDPTSRQSLEPGRPLLADRVALITAGASGMGRAAALSFAAHGAHVVVVDIDEAAARATTETIRERGGSAEFERADLTSEDSIHATLAAVGSRHDRLDVLFNHAGAPAAGGLEFSAADWDRCMALNLRAPMVVTQAALPLLRNSDGASIIFTASVSGLVASPFSPLYAAAKGGVVLFMKSVAVALGPEGIRANAICPGPTDTPMLATFFGGTSQEDPVVREKLDGYLATLPLRRVGQPSEVADVALFLASPMSSYLTGLAIPVDGGFIAR